MKTKAAPLLALLLAAPAAGAATFTVTNLTDGPAPGPAGSLRKAISDSNGTTGPNTITFTVAGVLTLSAGQLDITKPVTISVPPLSVTINASSASRIFHVGTGTTVFLYGLFLENGASATSGGCILNEGTLNISRHLIFNCS